MNDRVNFKEGKFMDFFGVLTDAWRASSCSFYAGMETSGKVGLEKLSGGRLERILKTDIKSDQGGPLGASVVFLPSAAICDSKALFSSSRYYEADPGGRHHHGREYRNDGDVLALKPYRN